MKRTISAGVGKGSVNHNSRKFKAANVDPKRNIEIGFDRQNRKRSTLWHIRKQ